MSEISIRSTKISTFDKCLIILPNGEIFTNAVIVMTAQLHLRSQDEFGMAYDTEH